MTISQPDLEEENINPPESSQGKLPRVFFCHLPKCAGTSVTTMLETQVFFNDDISTFSINAAASHRAAKKSGMSMTELRKALLCYNLSIQKNQFGSGHVFCPPSIVNAFKEEWDFVTLFRNPVDRWISDFVFNSDERSYWSKVTPPLKQYLSSDNARRAGSLFLRCFSSMPKQYLGDVNQFIDEAVENLRQFRILGTVENLEGWQKSFERYYEVKISISHQNASPNSEAAKKIRADKSMMRQIESLCEPDLILYEKIVDEFAALT